MKKVIALAAIMMACMGCSATMFMTSVGIAERTYIGMSVEDFMRLYSNASLLEMTEQERVYGVALESGSSDGRVVWGVQAFHFDSNDRLFKLETRDVLPEPRRHTVKKAEGD